MMPDARSDVPAMPPGTGLGKTRAPDRPSYYAATIDQPFAAPPLHDDVTCDVCVIGAGFAGLGAALALARAGRSVRLIDAGPVGCGASGRNGGQVHVGWQQDLAWFERRLGEAATAAVWQAALAARAHLDTLIALDAARCDFRAGLIHADHRPGAVAQTHAHVAMMRDRWDYASMTALGRDDLRALVASGDYHGGSFDARGGHLHPLKLALAMARAAQAAGAVIHAHSRCTALTRARDGWQVMTPGGRIAAGQVLDASGAGARAPVRQVDAHILPINNYIATTARLDPALAHELIANGAAVADARFVVYYFRVTPDHRLLFGGGESYGTRMPRDIAGVVRRHMLRIFPQLAGVDIDHAWGGTLAISPNRLPFVLEPHPGLFALNGFSGVGVALAPWLGDAVGRAMAGEANPGYDLMRHLPSPRFPGGRRLRGPTRGLAMRLMALRDRF